MPDPDQIPYVSIIKHLSDPDSIRDVPVIGDLYGLGNTVIDYLESDCNPDWWVYAETLFPALGEAVLVVLSFGLDDVLRGYFRPAGGRGFGGLGRASRRARRPTKPQRARGLLRGGIPEIGELLGRNLPGAEVVRARQVGNAERFLWRVDGLAQRGLWYWLIADIAEDLAINWTTALYSSEECSGTNVGGVVRNQPTTGISAAPLLTVVNFLHLEDDWGPGSSSGTNFTVPAGFFGSLTAFMTAEHWLPPGGGFRVGIRDQGTGNTLKWSEEPIQDPETGLFKMGVSLRLTGGHTYQVVVQNTGGLARAIDGEAVMLVYAP